MGKRVMKRKTKQKKRQQFRKPKQDAVNHGGMLGGWDNKIRRLNRVNKTSNGRSPNHSRLRL